MSGKANCKALCVGESWFMCLTYQGLLLAGNEILRRNLKEWSFAAKSNKLNLTQQAFHFSCQVEGEHSRDQAQ